MIPTKSIQLTKQNIIQDWGSVGTIGTAED